MCSSIRQPSTSSFVSCAIPIQKYVFQKYVCVGCRKVISIMQQYAVCLPVCCSSRCQKRHWKVTHKKGYIPAVPFIPPTVSSNKNKKKQCTFSACEKTAEKVSACIRCSVPYCSLDCQRKDWPKHKPACLEAARNFRTLDPVKKARQRALRKGEKACLNLLLASIAAPDDDKRMQILIKGTAEFKEMALKEADKLKRRADRQIGQVRKDYDLGINKEAVDKPTK